MKKTNFLCLMALVLVFTSCQQDQSFFKSDNSELLQVHDIEKIIGSNTEDGLLISYEVTTDEKDMTHLDTDINGKKVEAFLNYDKFTVRYDAHDNILTAEEMLALNKTSIKIAKALHEKAGNASSFDVTAAENSLVRVMSHWSEAPPNFLMTTKENVGGLRSNKNDGIKCVRKGRWYNILFDDDRPPSQTHTFRKKVNGDGGPRNLKCIGRCGGRCGNWFFPSAWTLDCFEHDWCYSYLDAGTGGFDERCGDEWVDAMDDWMFGVLAGCNGRRG